MKFTEFDLDAKLLEGIASIGFSEATPIQEKAIPSILNGKDLIASAQTGTGKTAAFLLPIIHKIITSQKEEHISALIIVPTRELAVQIDQQLEGLSYFTPVNSIAVYGGSDGAAFSREKKALSGGVDMVIGTPGRLIAHLNMGYVKVEALDYLILDEADRMLDMGFYNDLMKIISYLPKKRQNLLFSATMPPKIRDLAKKILHEPDEINIALSTPPESIFQYAFIVYENQKIPLLQHLLHAKPLNSVLIFCSTKLKAKEVRKALQKDFEVEEIHSDLEQKDRNTILTQFKNRKLKYLVSTDVLSRGIDIEDIELVINFDVPNDVEDYIHRIGRTARAASKGIAFTFVNEKEQRSFARIEKHLNDSIKKPKIPEKLGSAPEYHIDKLLSADKPKRRKNSGKSTRKGSKRVSNKR